MFRKLQMIAAAMAAALLSAPEPAHAQPSFGQGQQVAVPNAWGALPLTIDDDSVTISRAAHTLAAESGTADELCTVVTTGLVTGHAAVVKAAPGEDITLKNGGACNITTDTGADLLLSGALRATLYVTASGVDASLGGGGAGGGAALAAQLDTLAASTPVGKTVDVGESGKIGGWVRTSDNISATVTADTTNCISRPLPGSDGSDGGWLLSDYIKASAISPIWCGATLDGDDTAELQATFALADAVSQRVDLGPYNYVVSGTVYTLTSSDWEVFGWGESATRITQTADVPTFIIDTSGGYLFRINFRKMEFFNSHATGANSPAIYVDDDELVAGTLRMSVFSHLRFRGHEYGILFTDMDKVDDGAGNISVGTGGYNQFLFLHVPQYSRYPDSVVRFEGVNGVDQSFLGGQYRSKNYAIRAGACEAAHTIGDMGIVGIRFVLGNAAIKLCGPTDSSYKSSITITGNQFDVQAVNTIDLENLESIHVFGNASQFGVNPRLANVDLSRSTFEGPQGVYIYGGYFPHSLNTANRVLLDGAATGASPTVGVDGADADVTLKVEGKGAGGVVVATNRDNYWFMGGGTNDDSPFTANASLTTISPQGSDTLVDSRIASKGAATALILQDSTARRLGFFNSPGQTRPTVSADNFGNPAVISLLQELEDFNLIQDTSSAASANRLIADQNLGSNYTVTTGGAEEAVITASSITIPVTGAYLITAALTVRHADTAAADYSMRVKQDTTPLDVHDFISFEGAGGTDDKSMIGTRVVWLTAGTYNFTVNIVQSALTTTGATVFANSTSNRDSYLQIVRL